MKTSLWDWRVVLVRPRNPLNIGAAARAMANFGFEDLVVVRPHEPVWRETRSAVGAEDVVKSARAVPDLREAIADCTLVVGTTAGSRRNLDRELVPLHEFGKWLSGFERRKGAKPAAPRQAAKGCARAALLFGSEKTGLSNDALSHCHALVRIPTTPECPSMNLGQAVAVCCYQISRLRGSQTSKGDVCASPAPTTTRVHLSDRANMQSLLHVFERAERVLDGVGFLKPKSREATLLKLRRLLLDLGLTNNDVKILGGVLAQIEWKLQNPR